MKRRDLLRLGTTAGAVTVAGLPISLLDVVSRNGGHGGPRKGQIRNIVFFAFDGTGFEDLAAADFFHRRIGGGTPLHFERLQSLGAVGLVRPESLLSVVTDSAAASTAWSTGRRIVNKELAQYPDGRPLGTILELAREVGRRTALVTSTRMTHATPAAWVAHSDDRENEEDIALQYLSFAPDLMLGGGAGAFEASSRGDGRAMDLEFEAMGYDVVRTGDELARASSDRILGLFTPGDDHLPYEVDRLYQESDESRTPSLAELTREALRRLGDADEGFVLQIEAGRIDHANHLNDPGGMIWDWMAADEALGAAVEFTNSRSDTLLIAVPDHDTGAGAVYGYGPWYLRSTQAFETLHRRRASHEWLLRNVILQDPSPHAIREAVVEYLGIALAEPRADAIAAILAGEDLDLWRWGHPNAHSIQPANAIGHILSISELQGAVERPNVAFATGAHTGAMVPVVVLGPGVDALPLGIVDNTELFELMTAALGVRFENPVMSVEEAREIVEGSRRP